MIIDSLCVCVCVCKKLWQVRKEIKRQKLEGDDTDDDDFLSLFNMPSSLSPPSCTHVQTYATHLIIRLQEKKKEEAELAQWEREAKKKISLWQPSPTEFPVKNERTRSPTSVSINVYVCVGLFFFFYSFTRIRHTLFYAEICRANDFFFFFFPLQF